jgi:hypothetical protein
MGLNGTTSLHYHENAIKTIEQNPVDNKRILDYNTWVKSNKSKSCLLAY